MASPAPLVRNPEGALETLCAALGASVIDSADKVGELSITVTRDGVNDVLTTLRDEARLHLHLASLDAKQEWDEKLEPRINELHTSASDVSDGTRSVVEDLLARVEGFVSNLRTKVAGEDTSAAKS